MNWDICKGDGGGPLLVIRHIEVGWLQLMLKVDVVLVQGWPFSGYIGGATGVGVMWRSVKVCGACCDMSRLSGMFSLSLLPLLCL